MKGYRYEHAQNADEEPDVHSNRIEYDDDVDNKKCGFAVSLVLLVVLDFPATCCSQRRE